MAILKSSKTGTSYDTKTGIRTNADGTTTQVNKIENGQPTVITADTLSKTDTPVVLPEKTPDTRANEISNNLNTYANNQNLIYDSKMATLKEKNVANTDTITNLMKSISDTELGQKDIEKSLDSEENLLAYKQYSDEIKSLDENARQSIERIQRENPTGALRGGQIDQINAIQRETANKKAILTLQRSAALGDYNTAVDTAKAMVEMKVAPLKAELDRLKFVQESNEAFQTAEMNQIIKEKDAEIKKQEELENKIADMKVNISMSDAPNKNDMLRKLENAKTLDEALAISGKYGGDYLKLELLKQQIETEKAQRNKIIADTGTTKEKPATQAQFTASGFASRVVQAKDIIDQNQAELSKLSYADYLVQRKLPNVMQSPLVQKQLQAERNFVNAVLRRESGAAISPEEFKSAEKQYFPMPGDTVEVLAQKKANRDLTSQNIINESGSAYTAPEITNPFQQALGKTNEKIQGTSIVESVSNGVINFKIPTK